jgi:hypothetical protein
MTYEGFHKIFKILSSLHYLHVQCELVLHYRTSTQESPLVNLNNIWVGYNWILPDDFSQARSMHTRLTWRIGVGAPDRAASKFTRLCVTRQPYWSLFNIFHKECGDCNAQYDTKSFVWRMECFTKCSKYWAAHITMRYNICWYCITKRVHRKAPLVYRTNIWVGYYNWIISNCIRKARIIHTRVTWRIGVGAPRHSGTKDLKIVCNTAAMLITSELIPFRIW